MSIAPQQILYQIVYVGQEGLPEFLDIPATTDTEAQTQAAEWIAKNKQALRENNYSVTLIKNLSIFTLSG